MLILHGAEFKKQLEGDAIYSSILRTTLEPVPLTFEATIRLDPRVGVDFVEGKELLVGRNKAKVVIVHAENIDTDIVQDMQKKARKITAVLSSVSGISFRRQSAVFKENATLSDIYAACGAKTAIGKDFTVPRFYCYQGDTPSFHIARLLQEEGGFVKWDADTDKIEFVRINDAFKVKAKAFIPALADVTRKSGFIERHEIPAYFSIEKGGGSITGDFSKPRAVMYSPQKTAKQLYAMSQVLLNVKTFPAEFSPDKNAGDLLEIGGTNFIIITAAHESSMSSDGGYVSRSQFWLGVRS